ncbi:hypothetical protein [Streptosporangium sp. LJ11]|uniref:hypothetical protein n=1 Tax=Streptosporangium sp. LJ11 TaxID=3436927 RepID=UPI003F7ABEA8
MEGSSGNAWTRRDPFFPGLGDAFLQDDRDLAEDAAGHSPGDDFVLASPDLFEHLVDPALGEVPA